MERMVVKHGWWGLSPKNSLVFTPLILHVGFPVAKGCCSNYILYPMKGFMGYTRKLCKVSWKVVVREKARGSLGAGSLQGKNKALLFKWLWCVGDPNSKGWRDIIKHQCKPSFAMDF